MDINFPALLLAYGVFALTSGLTLFFFFRSFKDGYWNRDSENVKYQVFNDEPVKGPRHERSASR